jgi:hypothetical protein
MQSRVLYALGTSDEFADREFILHLARLGHIHRLGSVHLRHLGEATVNKENGLRRSLFVIRTIPDA